MRAIEAMPAWWKGSLLILLGSLIHPIIALLCIIMAGYYVGSKYPDDRERAALKSLQTGSIGFLLYFLLFLGLVGPGFVELAEDHPGMIPSIIVAAVQIILVVFLVGIWASKRSSVLRPDDL